MESPDSTETDLPPYSDETIAAISTPQGRGAVGVVRISGSRVLPALARTCRKHGKDYLSDPPAFSEQSRKAIYCSLYTEHGEILDHALVTFFKQPHSYTGEDVAEFSLHGNPLLLRQFVYELIKIPGIRPANPGEFTMRAYLNGKIDLTQAEAVRRIIEARSELELISGRKVFNGELKKKIYHFRSRLVGLKAETEAEVDFSEEDLTYETREARIQKINEMLEEIRSILKKSREVSSLARGIQIALAGIPNAGKSSLLNRILGWDRAIVSETAGTTRDYLSEEIQLNGIPVRFVDTAGLRISEDKVEMEGIKRSKAEIDHSEIIFHVIDGSLPPYTSPELNHHGVLIHILNKCDDLHPDQSTDLYTNCVRVSCRTGEGIEELKSKVEELFFNDELDEDPLLLEERQQYHFERIEEALHKIISLWEVNAPDEITALEIDRALDHVGLLTGRVDTEEILGRIFSTFCVGK